MPAFAALLLLFPACGGDEGSVLSSEGGECVEVGEKSCGLTGEYNPAGVSKAAVLICATTLHWEADEICNGLCVDDAVHGVMCEGWVPGADGSPADGLDQVDQPDDLIGDAGPEDAQKTDVEEEVDEKEVVFKDLMPDLIPPWVESVSPEDGAMNVEVPFKVQITFTESMKANMIGEQTVKMTDAAGDEVSLEYSFTDETSTVLVCTPTEGVFHSSPYTVTLDSILKDLAGNMLGNTYQFSFFTGPVPSLGHYKELAGKFAPLIYQETNNEFPHYDFFTRFDLDQDWIAENNVDYIKKDAVKVESYAYYSVTETKSHFFITYTFYYPFRYTEDAGARFGNDVSGAVVVVRKADETPIAVETYFKREDDERSYSYVVKGCGLFPDEAYAENKFKGIYDGESLFPNGHYVAYLSARTHESCLWLDEGNSGILDRCKLNAGIKSQMKKLEYHYTAGTPTIIEKSGGTFPQQLEDVGYTLTHILEGWWPRRGDVGTALIWASTFSYEPHTSTIFPNRPELTHVIPSLFVNPIDMNDNGRPPWAWKWAPQDFQSGFYNINRGVLFLDPAVHFKQRHDQANNWADFDGENGWSLEYCFNPYFNLDFRGIWPECTATE